MSNINKIREVLDPIATENEVIINDLIWRTDNQERVLEIPIMFSNKTMDLETCGKMSSLFIDALEQVESMNFDYSIDVCSPGAERVLNSIQDMVDEIENYVYVKFVNPTAGTHEIYGTLKSVNDDEIGVEYLDKTRKKVFDIATDNIALIRLAIKF